MKPVLCIATGRSCARLLPLAAPGEDRWRAPWRAVEMLDGARIHRLATRPGAPGDLFAASWGEGLWFSRDGGRRWSNAPIDIPGSRVHCVCAASSPMGEAFVGSEHATLKRSSGDLRRWELLDNLWLVPSSSRWGAGEGGGNVRDVAVNPRHEEWLLAAVDGAGVLFSSDGGFSWDDARPGTDPATRLLLWHPDAPTHALALAPSSLRLSGDGGWSWQEANIPVAVLRTAAALPGGEWLVAGGSRAGESSEVWRSDGGGWLLVKKFEPREAVLESALVGGDSEIEGAQREVWLAGWSDGTVEVSLDSGRSWRALLVDLAEGARIERAAAMALCEALEDETEDPNTGADEKEA